MHSKAPVFAPQRIVALVTAGLLPKTALHVKRKRMGPGKSNSGPVGKKNSNARQIGRMQATWALQAKSKKRGHA